MGAASSGNAKRQLLVQLAAVGLVAERRFAEVERLPGALGPPLNALKQLPKNQEIVT